MPSESPRWRQSGWITRSFGRPRPTPILWILAAPLLVLWPSAAVQSQNPAASSVSVAEIAEAVKWIRAESGTYDQHDYIVSASVRLLFFWVSRDDVGQGYIRIGPHPLGGGAERVELLMGSDPAKVPMKINRWGAATEVYRPSDRTGAFFGFMKSSKGQSVSEMRAELSREDQSGKYLFDGNLTRQSQNRAVAMVVPITSDTDFTLHQLPQAEEMVVDRLGTTTRPPRVLEASDLKDCSSGRGFLFTVRELIEACLSGLKLPQTRCYTYSGRRYTLTLQEAKSVAERKVPLKLRGAAKTVESVYRDLQDAGFRITNMQTGNRTDFRLLYGTSGKLRGIPVLVEYQPNWWFKAILKAKPEPTAP